jgi:trehalose 2-sulfotransferase
MSFPPSQEAFLVCATPRSGSTLVCQALKQTGVAGRPEEYFEALRHSARPRRPEEYFDGVDDPSILEQLGDDGPGPEAHPVPCSRGEYDRYLARAIEAGTTPNGVFSAKLMWGYFDDFVSLVRSVSLHTDLALPELLPAVFGEDLA